jgi:hypothetical protein
MTNEAHVKKRRRQVQTAVDKMTAKQLQVCAQLKIPPQDYIIIMNKVHI